MSGSISFNVADACKYGIERAVLINYFQTHHISDLDICADYFSKILGLNSETIIYWIKDLKEKGLIEMGGAC